MLRFAIAHHARKASFVAASCCALLVCAVTTALLVNDQWRSIAQSQQMGSNQVQKIRNALVSSLEEMNRSYKADCQDSSLRALRHMLFHTPEVGDFGVMDEQGRLICSAVVGVLAKPLEVNRPDTTVIDPHGNEVHVTFQTTLRAIETAIPSTTVGLGRFDAVISPYAIQDLVHTGVSAVQLANPRGGIFTAVQDSTLDANWSQSLRSQRFVGTNLQTYSWSDAAFVAVQHVPQSAYYVQTLVPLHDFLHSYARHFAIGLVVALLMGWLSYQAMVPRFVRWRSLTYRIDALLNEKSLVCVYQPIIDLHRRRTVGCEVLMRLQVGKETLMPDVVLPAIIARGLTWRLDQLVVRKAVAELARHLPDVQDFKVAFNFFPANVTSAKLEELFASVLRDTPHRGLVFNIEVLEQAYGDGIVEEITRLRRNRFLFSVDDFGTGYSNLGSIKAISPDFLKIDRSFVRDMEDASLRSSLIPEIMGIARAVDAQVIAEGIENAQQLKMLYGMGVDYGQGYFFARPQPIEDLVQYLAQPEALAA